MDWFVRVFFWSSVVFAVIGFPVTMDHVGWSWDGWKIVDGAFFLGVVFGMLNPRSTHSEGDRVRMET